MESQEKFHTKRIRYPTPPLGLFSCEIFNKPLYLPAPHFPHLDDEAVKLETP